MTTAWFHSFHREGGAVVPRVSAAHVYRMLLGFDVAKQQGLLGDPETLVDYDNADVTLAPCSPCHGTVDPMSFPFAYYKSGLEGEASSYDPNRPNELGLWNLEEEPFSALFANPVTDLVDLAQQAANSEPFQREITRLFYRHVIGHDPRPEDSAEFIQLWRSLPLDGYSPRLLHHRIIDATAFGVP